MTTSVATSQNTKAGMCPHGLPHAACPVCSGGMSARVQQKSVTKPIRKDSNEWSFMKCYAVGLAMKNQEKRAENAKNAFERQIEFGKELSKNIQNIADKIQAAIQNIQSKAPDFMQAPLNLFTNFIFKPAVNMLMQIPKLIEKFVLLQRNSISLFLQAGEKITAITGDIKNFINRKFKEGIKKTAKKFFLLFIHSTEDENYGNDETLAIFKSREIKKYLIKFVENINKKDKNADKRIKNQSE